MEHGGFAEDDTHVTMLTVNGANVVNSPPVGATITARPRQAGVDVPDRGTRVLWRRLGRQ